MAILRYWRCRAQQKWSVGLWTMTTDHSHFWLVGKSILISDCLIMSKSLMRMSRWKDIVSKHSKKPSSYYRSPINLTSNQWNDLSEVSSICCSRLYNNSKSRLRPSKSEYSPGWQSHNRILAAYTIHPTTRQLAGKEKGHFYITEGKDSLKPIT